MRRVKFSHGEFEKKEGFFHKWAIQDDFNLGRCPVAIIELEDGQVTTVHAGWVKFLDPYVDMSHENRND